MDLLGLIGRLVDYYDKTLSEQALDVYLEGLQDLPLDLLERAIKRWIAASPWMPKVSELREMVESIKLEDVCRASLVDFDSEEEIDIQDLEEDEYPAQGCV